MKKYSQYSYIIILLLWIIAPFLEATYYDKDIHYGWTKSLGIFEMIYNLRILNVIEVAKEFGTTFYVIFVAIILNIIVSYSNLYKHFLAFNFIQLSFIIIFLNIGIPFCIYSGVLSVYGLFYADGEWLAEGWPSLHVIGLYVINAISLSIISWYKLIKANKSFQGTAGNEAI